jgi:hypothetical protein
VPPTVTSPTRPTTSSNAGGSAHVSTQRSSRPGPERGDLVAHDHLDRAADDVEQLAERAGHVEQSNATNAWCQRWRGPRSSSWRCTVLARARRSPLALVERPRRAVEHARDRRVRSAARCAQPVG